MNNISSIIKEAFENIFRELNMIYEVEYIEERAAWKRAMNGLRSKKLKILIGSQI